MQNIKKEPRRLNADWTMQLFCGIHPGTSRIKDLNLVPAWRMYLSRYLDIDKLQSQFAGYWKPYIEHTQGQTGCIR